MSKENTKKAVEMLLGGATLLGEPCPYCGGVRVIKDGNALCAGCGRKPEERPDYPEGPERPNDPAVSSLEKKIEMLGKELEGEGSHDRQQEILKSINSLIETIERLKNRK